MAKNVNFDQLIRSSTNNEAPLEGQFDTKFTTDKLAYRMPRQMGSERNNAIQESRREWPVRHPYRTFKNTQKNAQERHHTMRDNIGGRKRKSRGKRTKKGKKANKKSANKKRSVKKGKKSKKSRKTKKGKKGKKSKKIKKTKKGGMDSNEHPATPPSGNSGQGMPGTPGASSSQNHPTQFLAGPLHNNFAAGINNESDDDSAVLPAIAATPPANQNDNNVNTPTDTESDSDNDSFTTISTDNSQQEIEEEKTR
jgi:hypothetical protein